MQVDIGTDTLIEFQIYFDNFATCGWNDLQIFSFDATLLLCDDILSPVGNETF